MKKIVIFSLFFLISNLNYVKANEFIKFKYFDSRQKKEVEVAAQIFLPKKTEGKLPVIIAQHGSTRDTMKLKKGGKSNEFAKRIMKRGIKEGYAVVVPDLFYKKKDVGSKKTKFPNGRDALMQLKKIIMQDSRFDRDNVFYTGFSWGGALGAGFLQSGYSKAPRPFWKAMSLAEPGCNIVAEPIKYDFPILFIQGEKSHYPPEPCIFYQKLINKVSGNDASLEIIKGANHFYSTDLKEVKGTAINACSDDIVIKKKDNTFIRASGKALTKRPIKECWGSRVIAGKNYKKLDEAIDLTINFFNKHNR